MPKQSSIHSELTDALFRLRRSFYLLAGFSGVINAMMLTPAIYMLQVYDRALVSRNVTTLTMLTVRFLRCTLDAYLPAGRLFDSPNTRTDHADRLADSGGPGLAH